MSRESLPNEENKPVVDGLSLYRLSARVDFAINVFDPVANALVFHAEIKEVNWSGIDFPIVLRVFNEVRRWVDESRSLSRQCRCGLETAS